MESCGYEFTKRDQAFHGTATDSFFFLSFFSILSPRIEPQRRIEHAQRDVQRVSV